MQNYKWYCFMKEELMAENEDWTEEIMETCKFC